MKRTAALSAAGATALLLSSLAPVSAVEPTVWFVDDDKAQCAEAGLTSIQEAINRANPGDTVQVCPGTYAENVTITKSISLRGEFTNAAQFADEECFTPQANLGPTWLDPSRFSILKPGRDRTDPNVKTEVPVLNLQAEGVDVSGFVIRGHLSDGLARNLYSRGIQTSHGYSGYRIHDNFIFESVKGIALGAGGTAGDPSVIAEAESSVDHNCIRENQYGVIGEGAIRNAVVEDNKTFRNVEQAFAVYVDFVLTPVTSSAYRHNSSVGDFVTYLVFGSRDLTIADNKIKDTVRGIQISAGGNNNLTVRGNTVTGVTVFPGRTSGRPFGIMIENRTFGLPTNTNVLIEGNTLTGGTEGRPDTQADDGTGIEIQGNAFQSSVRIMGNNASDNKGAGIAINFNNNGNTVEGNTTNGNGLFGIVATANPNTDPAAGGGQIAKGNIFSNNTAVGTAKGKIAEGEEAFYVYTIQGVSKTYTRVDILDMNLDANGSPLNTWSSEPAKQNTCVTKSPETIICKAP